MILVSVSIPYRVWMDRRNANESKSSQIESDLMTVLQPFYLHTDSLDDKKRQTITVNVNLQAREAMLLLFLLVDTLRNSLETLQTISAMKLGFTLIFYLPNKSRISHTLFHYQHINSDVLQLWHICSSQQGC